ncbi:P-loop domain-containing protein [Streptomyces lydicus]|uniref:AAA family ATPase n=1 Tax=Streptomyces lydicus TaxID=47763 RepID=UPI0037922A06
MATALVVGMSNFEEKQASSEDWWGAVSLHPLSFVPGAAASVAEALGSHPGITLYGEGPRIDLSYAALEQSWRDAFGASALARSGLIVHFLGHGVKGATDNELYLAARDTRPRELAFTAVDVDRWLKQVENTESGPPVLLLLDVCGAGRATMQQWLHRLSVDRRRAWVIAACADDEKAYGARFSRATSTVLARLKAGWLDLSPGVPHVPVETFAKEIDRELARLLQVEGRAPQRVLRTAHPEADGPVPPFLQNPAFRETPADRYRQHVENGLWQFASAVDPGLDVVHFVSRASGTPHQQNITRRCFFTGRRLQLAQLKEWLENEKAPTLTVVTGSPGSGKSALLGVLTCLAHEQLREVSGPIRSVVPSELRVERHPRFAAVHARQRDPAAVLTSIASQLGLDDAPQRGWTTNVLLERLRQPAPAQQPAIVVVDALDEASLDKELLRTVLLPLARAPRDPHGAPVCKVVIGVRPWWDRFPELQPNIRSLLSINLDDAPAEERARELGDYLSDLLEEAPAYSGPSTSTARGELARAVARRLVTVQHKGGFLLASLFAHYLAEHDRPLTAAEAVGRVPDDLPGMLDLHLGVLTRERPAIRSVLSAVAHGLGQGMPLEIIHVVAAALTAPPGAPPRLDDARDAIEAASFYVRTATDTDGRRLYRFFHQSLTDHLARADDADRRRLYEAVRGSVPGRDERGEPAWDLALPYVLRHAAQHAVSAGQFDGLLKSPGLLVHGDPTALRAQLSNARSLRARRVAELVASALDPQDDPWVRWEWLRTNAVAWQEKWLLQGLDALRTPDSRSRDVLTLQWGSQTRELGDGDFRYPERAVFAETEEGPVAVVAYAGGAIQLRDAGTGGVLTTLQSSDSDITALAASALDDTVSVAVGTASGNLVLWHMGDERPYWGVQLPDEVTGIAIGTLRGAWVLAACTTREVTVYSIDGTHLWTADLQDIWLAGLETDGPPEPFDDIDPFDGPDVTESALECTDIALAEFDGTPAVIVGTSAGTLELWDADGGSHRSCAVHTSRIHNVTPSRNGSTRHVVACADEGVRTLNLDDGCIDDLPASGGVAQPVTLLNINREEHTAIGRLGRVEIRTPRRTTSHAPAWPDGASLRALAADGPRLYAVAETRHHQAAVLTWISPDQQLSTWEGHDADVVSVALVGHEGRQLALSLSDDGTLHTWDTEDGLCMYSGRHPQALSATAGVLDGEPVAVLSEMHGTARLIGLTDGRTRRAWRWPSELHSLRWIRYQGRDTLCGLDSTGLALVDAAAPESVRRIRERGVTAYAVGDVGDSSLIALARWDGDLAVLDGRRSREFPVRDGDAGEELSVPDALAFGLHDGRPVVVSAFSDGLVTGHDAVSERKVFSFRTGDEVDVLALHTVARGSSFHVVSASYDGAIRVWSPFEWQDPLGEVQVAGQYGQLAVSGAGVLAAYGSRITYFSWATGQQTEG